MDAIIAEIGTKGDFPAAAQVVGRLRTTVGKENCPAFEVARVILQDPGTASKLLRLVNSVFYRKGGAAISTISRAVIVVGFEAIRDLATGFTLVEELLRQGRSSAFVRDTVRRSLLCGLVAQRLAPQVGYPSAEEAYLLGLFSEWGLLWLATYYGAEFERAQALARQTNVSLEAAVRAVFGGDPASLSAAILERWEFPPAFADHFRTSTARLEQGSKLSAIVELAGEYARAVEAGSEVPEAVLHRCERLFGLTPEQFLATAQGALEALQEQAPLLGVGRVPPRRDASVHSAGVTAPAPGVGSALRPDAADGSLAGAGVPAAPVSPCQSGGDAQAAIALVAEITRSLVEQRDLNHVLLMILEGLARIGGFEATFLALVNVHKDRLVGRLGYGDGVEEYLRALSVPVSRDAGVLAETMLERAPQIIPQGSPALLVPRGAPVPEIPVASLITAPLIVRQRAVGVLVALRAGGPAVTIADLPLVELFCNQAAVVLHHHAR